MTYGFDNGYLTAIGGNLLAETLYYTNTPTNPDELATKEYVDSVAQGLNIQMACFAASTASLTVTYLNGSSGVGATLTNAGTQATLSIDGTTPALTQRLLIKNQSTTFQNGIYTVTNVGSGSTNWVLTRSTDYDTVAQINPGDLVLIDNGTANANTSWVQTANVTTIGVDPILFTQFTANPASFLKVANNLSDVASASSSRANLGLAIGINVEAWSAVLDTVSAGTYLGSSSITTLGTISTGVWGGSIIQPSFGGTGVANSSTITLGGEITTTGKFDFLGTHDAIFRLTGNTDVTFPTSGTLSTSTGTVTNVSGTTNRITVATGTTTPVIDISASYVGQSSITTLGTVTTGVWTGTTIATANGGTGQTTYTDGQLLIGNSATSSLSKNTITAGTGITVTNGNGTITLSQTSGSNVTSISGTAHEIIASSSTGAVTLSTPQAIDTTSSPTFAALTLTAPLTGANGGTGVANTGLTINLSGGSTIKLMQSDSSGNATWVVNPQAELFRSTITNSSTDPTNSAAVGVYVQNNDSTLDNYMAYAFVSAALDTVGLVASQRTNTSVEVFDLVLFAKTHNSGLVEGLRLVGGTSTVSVTLSTPLGLSSGGTNANLTASNGGIFYSTGTAGAILAGTATADQVLLSGSSTTPAWSTATYPATTTINQLLYSSANNTITGLTTAAAAVLTTSSSVPTWASSLGVVLGGTGTTTAFTAGSVVFAGNSGMYSQQTGAGQQLFWDNTNFRLGAGTALPSGTMHAASANYPPLRGERTTALTTGVRSGISCLATSSGDMTDGFTSLLTFDIQDNAAVINDIADIGAARAGADNTGDLIFRTYLTGTATERMRLTSTGTLLLGTTTAPSGASALTVFNSTQVSSRITLTGQEFYQASNTSTDGVALLSGVNRGGNRQLWIADSAALTQNTTNTTIAIGVGTGIGSPFIDARATNGTTSLVLTLQNGGGTTVIGGGIQFTNFTSNGNTLWSVGMNCPGNSTVQKWLPISDGSNTFYIPLF